MLRLMINPQSFLSHFRLRCRDFDFSNLECFCVNQHNLFGGRKGWHCNQPYRLASRSANDLGPEFRLAANKVKVRAVL